MTGLDLLVGLFGLLAVGSAILVVTTRHLVRAALYLVVTLAAVAGCFLLLTAEFLAWVQVLIYVGAVVVLLLFGLMLTRAPIGPIEDLSRPRRLLAAMVAVASTGLLGAVLVIGFGSEYVDLDGPAAGASGTTGAALFRTWVLPFELVSLLLLAALVGAIALSRSDSLELSRSDPVAPSRSGDGQER